MSLVHVRLRRGEAVAEERMARERGDGIHVP